MLIYLYVKTHNKSGLKYLGKTTKTDPHKYSGSGKRWLRHLKKHGYDYSTEILLATTDKEELKETGIFFSNLWNIVESDDWANLREEAGDGGDVSYFMDKAECSDMTMRQKISRSHKKKVLDGTHHLLNGNIQKEANSKRIKDGTHNLLGQNNPSRKRIENGTHHFLNKEWSSATAKRRSELMVHNGTHHFLSKEFKERNKEKQQNRVEDGTHNFLGSDLQQRRIEQGTHNFLGRVSCIRKDGGCVQISKEEYRSQAGPMESWEYVVVRSKEGKRRRNKFTKC
jgi:hypothetical protein